MENLILKKGALNRIWDSSNNNLQPNTNTNAPSIATNGNDYLYVGYDTAENTPSNKAFLFADIDGHRRIFSAKIDWNDIISGIPTYVLQSNYDIDLASINGKFNDYLPLSGSKTITGNIGMSANLILYEPYAQLTPGTKRGLQYQQFNNGDTTLNSSTLQNLLTFGRTTGTEPSLEIYMGNTQMPLTIYGKDADLSYIHANGTKQFAFADDISEAVESLNDTIDGVIADSANKFFAKNENINLAEAKTLLCNSNQLIAFDGAQGVFSLGASDTTINFITASCPSYNGDALALAKDIPTDYITSTVFSEAVEDLEEAIGDNTDSITSALGKIDNAITSIAFDATITATNSFGLTQTFGNQTSAEPVQIGLWTANDHYPTNITHTISQTGEKLTTIISICNNGQGLSEVSNEVTLPFASDTNHGIVSCDATTPQSFKGTKRFNVVEVYPIDADNKSVQLTYNKTTDSLDFIFA